MTKTVPLAITRPSSESLYVSICYCFGSVNEPDGKHGINHLLEHILVSQLEKMMEKASHQIVCDGFTDTQLLRLDIKTIRQNLDLVIESVTRLNTIEHLDRDVFDAEKPAILGASELTSDPYYRVLELSRQTVFAGSKFSHPPDGYRNEIESLTLDDCDGVWLALKQDYRSAIGLGGDINNVEFGWVSGDRTSPNEHWRFDPVQTNVQLGIQGVECCLGTFVSGIDPILIDFLGFILGGSPHSLLFKTLRKDSGLAYDTRCLIDHYSTGSLIRLYFGLDNKTDLQKTINLVWNTFHNFEMDQALLVFYKEAFRCKLVFETDNPERFLAKSVYRQMIGIEHDPVKIFHKPAEYDSVTVVTKFGTIFKQDIFSVSTVK